MNTYIHLLNSINSISIHDLRGNRENEMNQLVVSSNLKAQDANVIVIDYSKLINLDQPLNVAATAPIVAEAIYDLVSLLKSKFNLELSLLHLVGYDLGGQIAGLCGQLISANYKEKVAHITALDPIGIIYTLETDADERLSPDDAIFVEVVHTNAGGQGFEGSCGHADYYPNGGLHQPGCNEEDECSHQRAYELVPDMWVPVRDHELFLAKCDSEDEMNDTVCRLHNLIMGDLQNGPLSGVYYLETTSKRPFGKGPKRQFW